MILHNKSKLNIEHRIPKSDKISKSWNDLDIKKNQTNKHNFLFQKFEERAGCSFILKLVTITVLTFKS